jgi:hypothetical protein
VKLNRINSFLGAAWIYLAFVVASLVILAAAGFWAYLLHPIFPRSGLHSSDVVMVLVTAFVAAANVSLVLLTSRYTDLVGEQIKLSREQNAEALAIRFAHGLSISSHDPALFEETEAAVWVANLGVRSFIVREVYIRRNDVSPPNGRWAKWISPDYPILWNEIVAPGEKKLMKIGNSFWNNVKLFQTDVEVGVSIGDSLKTLETAYVGFHVTCRTLGGPNKPCKARPGFGSLWYPYCPKCGKQIGMFTPTGANSMQEAEDNWLKQIWGDFAKTCPNHSSAKTASLSNTESATN